MRIPNTPGHLCYCTNIHPGETWPAVLASLQNALVVRDKLDPKLRFGIGLRLSAQAAQQLGTGAELLRFQEWLEAHNCYVFTMNGFPYGGFHGKVVKDQVHAPDWTTRERIDYTKLLFDQLAVLLTEGMDGGVSTSPVSYRLWHENPSAFTAAKQQGAAGMLEVVAHLVRLRERTGKLLHLDVEPEPDGLLEDNEEFIQFFTQELLQDGAPQLEQDLGVSREAARAAIRDHLRLCYDVCHVAVEYEDHLAVLERLREQGIQVGKIQISAALKAPLLEPDQREEVRQSLLPYNESTYLHQTVFRQRNVDTLLKCPDLEEALPWIAAPEAVELRTHFHVPIFTDRYGVLESTRTDIETVLHHWRDAPFTPHLEVETYTWDVLPDKQQLTLPESIHRELAWVLNILT